MTVEKIGNFRLGC